MAENTQTDSQRGSHNVTIHQTGSGQTLTPDRHEHGESHSALIVKQMADLCRHKHIMYPIMRENRTSSTTQTQNMFVSEVLIYLFMTQISNIRTVNWELVCFLLLIFVYGI